ncbi:hypothetical protein K492DRAFT_165369 [Lichtheimia hyalospora FSU 10163]|nr:hypothetical protein K492DRAFT_165369 [Lichtheimia hyalospora FSU 10163]
MDPIAPHSASISAYMSVHSATNLAYAKHFGNLDTASSANFESLNAHGFKLSYVLENGEQGETFIQFATPLTKREEIRPVLEGMAREAEEALGWPSSLDGPPPVAAIAKAAYAGATNMYTPPDPPVPLDVFYPVSLRDAVGVIIVFLIPTFGLRNPRFESISRTVLKVLFIAHGVEGTLALLTCIGRGWYNPINVLKWTLSTTIFGFRSLGLLSKHGRQVRGV